MIQIEEQCPYCDTVNQFELQDIDQLERVNGKMICQMCGCGVLICSECAGCKAEQNEDNCYRIHPDWRLSNQTLEQKEAGD